MLDRDALLAFATKASFPTMVLDLPDLGGSVTLRSLSGAERDRFERDFEGRLKGPNPNIRAALAALCLCDEKGERLFRDADVDALGELPAPALDAIFDAARKLSGLGRGDVEDMEKN